MADLRTYCGGGGGTHTLSSPLGLNTKFQLLSSTRSSVPDVYARTSEHFLVLGLESGCRQHKLLRFLSFNDQVLCLVHVSILSHRSSGRNFVGIYFTYYLIIKTVFLLFFPPTEYKAPHCSHVQSVLQTHFFSNPCYFVDIPHHFNWMLFLVCSYIIEYK